MKVSDHGFFTTTQWTMVQAAAALETTSAQQALSSLCERYWTPLYFFARRHGLSEDAARDLTQGFFTFFLEKRVFERADRERGRFRSFLLTSFKNFMRNEWDRESAVKRGGSSTLLSLEFERAESLYRIEPIETRTPEQVYDEQWASTLMDRVLRRLADEMRRAGYGTRFRVLRRFLTESTRGEGYREAAIELGISETAVKVAVHRLRKRVGQLLRTEISDTVSDPRAVDDEIRCLLEVLSAR
ncbi:MAG: sigma-70 family RNA polymerase sigma factor [Acidobacteriota bacterium]|nr:MAG: sigma-70 family RNA polymerase sigma factor [Acidobacteriota bacterium]